MSGKFAKITGERIKQRNIKEIFEKLHTGGITMEKANDMSEETTSDPTAKITAFSWAWTGYLWYDVKTNQLVKTSEKGKNADKEHRVLTKISRNPMEHND